MESQICLGGEWVSAPKFAIGDAVGHLYDGLRDDACHPDKWLTYWYRGIVVGAYYNRTTNKVREWYNEGWVYVVEIEDGCAGTNIESWKTPVEEFQEHELKQSPRHARSVASRCNSKKEHHHRSPSALVSIVRCKAG